MVQPGLAYPDWDREGLQLKTGRGAVWFSALAWGASGRQFKSARPDQLNIKIWYIFCLIKRDVTISRRDYISYSNL